MRVAFLEPLDRVAQDMPPKFLGDHDVLTAPAPGELPAGYQDADAIVWSKTPVDAAFIDAMPTRDGAAAAMPGEVTAMLALSPPQRPGGGGAEP